MMWETNWFFFIHPNATTHEFLVKSGGDQSLSGILHRSVPRLQSPQFIHKHPSHSASNNIVRSAVHFARQHEKSALSRKALLTRQNPAGQGQPHPLQRQASCRCLYLLQLFYSFIAIIFASSFKTGLILLSDAARPSADSGVRFAPQYTVLAFSSTVIAAPSRLIPANTPFVTV